MLLKARDLDSDAVLQADLCIVGAGAAGISIARALRGRGLDIVLLEGGGFEPSARSQELYKAEMKTVYRGRRKDGGYPMTSRLRYFGGTTNHWRGWCRPLEGFDFEARDWIPHSGWPIDLQDLQPWYEQALDLVQIEPFEDDHGASRREGKRSPRLVDSERLVTRIFHYSPPTRFGTVYRQDLVGADRVRLLLESNVLELRSDASG